MVHYFLAQGIWMVFREPTRENVSTRIVMANFKDLKPGDKVTRLLAGVRMPMIVRSIDTVNNLIICAAIVPEKDRKSFMGEFVEGGWTFDRATGVEEDAYLGWGVKF